MIYNMDNFLGETTIITSECEFKDYTQQDWALLWIQKYGSIEGSHHKDWVLDQVVQILNGTKVIITLAKWENGYEEYRFVLGEPTIEYFNWVKK